jgi:hypothetical protein
MLVIGNSKTADTLESTAHLIMTQSGGNVGKANIVTK